MKLLVCISKTPDTTSKIAFTDNDTQFSTAGVQFILNPYDEWYALVRACELKEAHGGTVTVINVGEADNDQIIRKALAIGADDAVRVNAFPISAFFVSENIAAYAKANDFDIIFFGKETIDFNGSEVGGMVSELLDLPYISYANALTVEGNTATIDREIEGGKETVEVQFPFAVSAAKGMAEQRIASMQGIMKARSKPLVVLEPVELKQVLQLVSFALPPAKTGCKYVDADNVPELVRLLHEEAKVI